MVAKLNQIFQAGINNEDPAITNKLVQARRGQRPRRCKGGIVMALGNALTEAFITEKGVPWSRLLARYKMPSIKHSPEIVSHLIEARSADGPYGAKGVGEISSINTTPAILNAIANATGVRIYSLPVDQDALLRAIKAGQREVHTAWQDVK